MGSVRRTIAADDMQYYSHSPAALGLVDLGHQGYGALQLRVTGAGQFLDVQEAQKRADSPSHGPPSPSHSTPLLSLGKHRAAGVPMDGQSGGGMLSPILIPVPMQHSMSQGASWPV